MSSPRSPQRPRLLAIVARFKWPDIAYLAALEAHFEVFVAWSGEGGIGAPLDGIKEGLRGVPLGSIRNVGEDGVRSRLRNVISEFGPDLIQVMYDNHEDLTLIARELVGERTPIVFESRDPLTALMGARPGDPQWELECDALAASDRQILISAALRSYYERAHNLDLESSSLILPHAFAGATIAPPSPKRSARDGRVHIALVGTADAKPDHGRWYVDIIRRLVDLGFVVHSHFWDLTEFGISLDPYLALAEELEDYHNHPTVSYRRGTGLSELISRYDLMGVFYELDAAHNNESLVAGIGLPTKAVCGWLHGAIPVVCSPHYRGVIEWIEEFGIGFVIDGWEQLAELRDDPAAIAAAGERCLRCRERFTTEWTAAQIAGFVSPLLGS